MMQVENSRAAYEANHWADVRAAREARAAVPSPVDIARRLPRNQGEVGDTVVYRDPATSLLERMLVEGVLKDKAGVNNIYEGSGNRLINARYVTDVVKR